MVVVLTVVDLVEQESIVDDEHLVMQQGLVCFALVGFFDRTTIAFCDSLDLLAVLLLFLLLLFGFKRVLLPKQIIKQVSLPGRFL